MKTEKPYTEAQLLLLLLLMLVDRRVSLSPKNSWNY
jgi:hypothetical protein